MIEIERKFLVTEQILSVLEKHTGKSIIQGYISEQADGTTIRVRTKGETGYLTIKGPSTGISRSEFEYPIPFEDAMELLNNFCPLKLEKTRYSIKIGNHTWDVDQFHGKLEGLIVAEIELSSEDETFEKPSWIGNEVSDDPSYYNVRLIERLK